MSLAIFLVDINLPLGVATGVAYVGIIFLGWWFPTKNYTYMLAAIVSALDIAGAYLSDTAGVSTEVALINRGLSLAAIWGVALLIAAGRQHQETLMKRARAFKSDIHHQRAALSKAQEEAQRQFEERRRVEDEIRDLASLPETNPAPVMRFAEDGVLLYVNQAGRPITDALGIKIGHKATRGWHDWINTALETGRTRTEHQEADGKIYELQFSPVRETRHINVFGYDVTSDKRAAEWFQNLLDSAPDVMIISDYEGRIAYANNRTLTMLGYRSEDMIGMSVDDLVPPDVRDGHAAYRGSYQDNPTVRTMSDRTDLYALTADGSKLPVEISLSPISTHRGPMVCAAIRSVTKRREMEDTLRRSDARFNSFMEGVQLGIVVHNEFAPLFANSQALSIFGYRSLESFMALHSIADLLGPGTSGAIYADGGKFKRTEIKTTSLQGELLVLACRAFMIEWDGKPATCVTIGDITKSRIAEDKITELSKLASLGQMSAGIAHELNQPLNIIRMAAEGTAELLEDGDDIDDDYVTTKLELISDQTKRAAETIERMRLLAQGESDDIRTIDFAEIVSDALDQHRETISRLDVDVQVNYCNAGALVQSSEDKLRRVVNEILKNAFEAFERQRSRKSVVKPQLSISSGVNSATKRLEVRFRDNAGGMSDDTLKKVFDPFFTTKEVGEGLGLSVAKALVRSIKADISAHHVENGTEIVLRLARKPADEAIAQEMQRPEEPASLH